MSSRNALLTGLFTLTLLAGVAVVYLGETVSISGAVRWNTLKETLVVAHPKDHIGIEHITLAWTDGLLKNRQFIFYVALAFVAVSTVVLVLKTPSRKSKDPKDFMLEVLREEKRKAENLAKIKADFLNHVSHELRTPLAVIIGYVECITDGLYGNVAAKHQEILEIVAKQSTHLKEMIDQILIYSRLDSNRQPVHAQEFELPNIISELKDAFEFLCKQKELDLYWDLPKERITLQSDSETVKEVVSNLLQNAVKYTDRGSITLRARHIKENDMVTIEIADTGMGIPENYLATIFEPFTQVHKTSTEKSRGGIGLGLSIVKKHLDRLKGKISVESEVGKGTTFTIVLPRRFEHEVSREKQILNLFKIPYRRVTKTTLELPSEHSEKEVKESRQAVG